MNAKLVKRIFVSTFFLYSIFFFWQFPLFYLLQFVRYTVWTRLLYILSTRNHLIQVFDVLFLNGIFTPLSFSYRFLSSFPGPFDDGLDVCLIFHLFPIMLFDDRKYLKCDLTRWQNENGCFTMEILWVGAPVGMTHSVHFFKSGLTSNVVHCKINTQTHNLLLIPSELIFASLYIYFISISSCGASTSFIPCVICSAFEAFQFRLTWLCCFRLNVYLSFSFQFFSCSVFFDNLKIYIYTQFKGKKIGYWQTKKKTSAQKRKAHKNGRRRRMNWLAWVCVSHVFTNVIRILFFLFFFALTHAVTQITFTSNIQWFTAK